MNYYNPNQNSNQNQGYYQYQQANQQAFQAMMLKQQIEKGKKAQRKELIKTGLLLGATLIMYLLIQTVMVGLLSAFNALEDYQNSVAFQYGFNVIAVHLASMLIPFGIMALILKKNFISPFFPAKAIEKKQAFAWIGFGMGGCIVANLITSYIMTVSKNIFGYELKENGYDGHDSILSCVILIVSTMIVPAVCEEIALRCCAFGVLKKFGKGFSVFAVSIVFGLMHGNAVQFIFAFLVGLILAYITIKTDNVILAMIVHGLNNGISVLADILEYSLGDKVSETATVVVFYAWAIIGVVCLIYLAVKGMLKIQKQPKSVYDNSFFVKLLCLMPGLFIPFVILIKLTSEYITKV